MSTVLNTNGEKVAIPVPKFPGFVFEIVVAEWNPEITHALCNGAIETLLAAGISRENIRVHSVPGTVELVNAASFLMHPFSGPAPAGVIVIGCVVRGDTPHFDYVCMQVAQGVAILNAEGRTPVTFGVLTVDNMQQALDRAGGKYGNKGEEAACAAITMANLHIENA